MVESKVQVLAAFAARKDCYAVARYVTKRNNFHVMCFTDLKACESFTVVGVGGDGDFCAAAEEAAAATVGMGYPFLMCVTVPMYVSVMVCSDCLSEHCESCLCTLATTYR